jgi:hypothetical protein
MLVVGAIGTALPSGLVLLPKFVPSLLTSNTHWMSVKILAVSRFQPTNGAQLRGRPNFFTGGRYFCFCSAIN